jgi:hypothetical protein
MIHPIDFVLPWVDSSDPDWQEQRAQYDIAYHKNERTDTRFRDMHTLKYVLRSIEKHCPWYHKIYLITAGHYPDWLDISHPNIELITHETLFTDPSVLPVFNSNAIEMNLVNIKNLSEYFVYLNDDTIIWNALKTDRFFQNNRPIDFFSHSPIPRNSFFKLIKNQDNTWIDSLNNNIRLINEKFSSDMMSKDHLFHSTYTTNQKINNILYKYLFKKLNWVNHWHHPQPYTRSTLKQVYEAFSNEMIETSRHKFRTSSDITPYIYRYWHLVTGNFEPFFHNDGVVVRISSLGELEHTITIIEKSENINFVCFNDQASNMPEEVFKKISEKLISYLEDKFPYKASFEY